ncbi:hypothetical protein HAX54_052770, partial [Datura stramonium]|nr:hypothetical protein [Datura stramonium]
IEGASSMVSWGTLSESVKGLSKEGSRVNWFRCPRLHYNQLEAVHRVVGVVPQCWMCFSAT